MTLALSESHHIFERLVFKQSCPLIYFVVPFLFLSVSFTQLPVYHTGHYTQLRSILSSEKHVKTHLDRGRRDLKYRLSWSDLQKYQKKRPKRNIQELLQEQLQSPLRRVRMLWSGEAGDLDFRVIAQTQTINNR